MSNNQFSESGPKEEQITNDDHSVTNHDDDGLEKGELATEQNKPDDQRVPTITPDNDSGEPGAPASEKEEEDSSNKGKGPAGENL
jgi:hypothetical protein